MPQVHIPPRNRIWWFCQQPSDAEVDKIQCAGQIQPHLLLYYHWHSLASTLPMHPAPTSCTHFCLHTGTPLLTNAKHQEVVFPAGGSDLGSHLSPVTLPMVRWLDIWWSPTRFGCHSGRKWDWPLPPPPSYPYSSPDCQALGPMLFIPQMAHPSICYAKQSRSFLSCYINTCIIYSGLT